MSESTTLAGVALSDGGAVTESGMLRTGVGAIGGVSGADEAHVTDKLTRDSNAMIGTALVTISPPPATRCPTLCHRSI